ncbi:hypothetical protein EYF80_062812 [Liparis tanakae]|uniref:Uncharacterized protein n=1 Tax=Liparis tanakae TaxID=230148 RepID=A0A4Z2EE58_9TELE|nr:hypothetical protein EYF80_062812 [Liparis tanakae]
MATSILSLSGLRLAHSARKSPGKMPSGSNSSKGLSMKLPLAVASSRPSLLCTMRVYRPLLMCVGLLRKRQPCFSEPSPESGMSCVYM